MAELAVRPEEEPQDAPSPPGRQSLRVMTEPARPLVRAFVGTVGVLLAVTLAAAVVSLATIVLSVGIALFLALALDPVVGRLQAAGLPRGRSVLVVFTGLALVALAIVAFVVPAAIDQVVGFAGNVPTYVAGVRASGWFAALSSASGGGPAYDAGLAQVGRWLADPAHLFALGTGLLSFGAGLVNAVSATVIVAVLVLYFLASLDAIKAGFYRLAPAYSRPRLARLTDQITAAVGGFVSGGVTLSGLNAAFSFLLLTLLGVPYAVVLAVLALVITLVPMIGSVLFWILATAVAFLGSWWAGCAFAVVYLLYMQVEAYVITPRVMNRAVSVPGALVLIGAMIGGTLLGLVGALVAVPVTASVLLVVKGVLVPRQDARTASPHEPLAEGTSP